MPPRPTRATMKVAKGFKVELIYTVPRDEQGSWVNMCVVPKGRLIVSDQYGALYRVTPPPSARQATRRSRRSPPDRRGAGALWAFDSLYVVVNGGQQSERPLPRHRIEGDDARQGRDCSARFEAAAASTARTRSSCSPGRQIALVVCGNADEAHRVRPARSCRRSGAKTTCCRACRTATASCGRARARAAASTTCRSRRQELGARQRSASATSTTPPSTAHGDLFTYDADMEWDFNTPWYRPTRVCHVASGSEFGWRNGAGKWPAYYPTTCRPSSTSAPARRPASLRLWREVPGEISGRLVHLRLELRQALRRSSDARRQRLQGRGRRVRHRHAAAADRCGRQPAGRRDVLHHRRTENQSRASIA